MQIRTLDGRLLGIATLSPTTGAPPHAQYGPRSSVRRRRTEQRLNKEQERQGPQPEYVVEFGRGPEESRNTENRDETTEHK
jgi:hypothetical protein